MVMSFVPSEFTPAPSNQPAFTIHLPEKAFETLEICCGTVVPAFMITSVPPPASGPVKLKPRNGLTRRRRYRPDKYKTGSRPGLFR